MLTNNTAADPRLAKLVQQVDTERKGRITAERRVRALRLALARALAAQRKAKAVESASTA